MSLKHQGNANLPIRVRLLLHNQSRPNPERRRSERRWGKRERERGGGIDDVTGSLSTVKLMATDVAKNLNPAKYLPNSSPREWGSSRGRRWLAVGSGKRRNYDDVTNLPLGLLVMAQWWTTLSRFSMVTETEQTLPSTRFTHRTSTIKVDLSTWRVCEWVCVWVCEWVLPRLSEQYTSGDSTRCKLSANSPVRD